MSQNDRILKHLIDGKTITSLEALDLFGCFRLGARIQDLEAEGYKIDSKMIDLPNGKRCAQYRLVGMNGVMVSCDEAPRPVSQKTRPQADSLFSFKTDPLGRKVAV